MVTTGMVSKPVKVDLQVSRSRWPAMIEDHAHVVHVFGRGRRPQKPHHVLLTDLGFTSLSDLSDKDPSPGLRIMTKGRDSDIVSE